MTRQQEDRLGRRARPVWRAARRAAALSLLALVAACSGGGGAGNRGSVNIGNSQTQGAGSLDFPIFYVKRTIPKTADDLRLLAGYSPGADLYRRTAASPQATEVNITARITAGGAYDVKDLDASPDGTRVAFAMRGPLKANQDPKDPPCWRIWEYVIATDTLAPMIAGTDIDPATVNDVSPHYLPDGRIVFSSTRQRQSLAVLLDEGLPQFVEQDEARTEPTFNLHVISVDRTQISQISFNQSHDRDATVLASGRILWSRWDFTPGHDGMHLFSSNPDGTDQQLYYGANSHPTGSGNSLIEFVRPREMQDGRIVALIRPYTDAGAAVDGVAQKIDFGGELVLIDGTHYVENTQGLAAYAGLAGPAQTRATGQDVVTVPGPSPGGRFGSVYPLWDGTGRLLVTWTPCLLQNTSGTLSPCANAPASDTPLPTAPPQYSVWVYSPAQNTFQPVMSALAGVMLTDVVAAQPRPLPNIILPQLPTTPEAHDLVATATGVIDIRSVYDVDGRDTAPGGIAAVAAGTTPATARPARFLRVVKAVSIPDKTVVDLAQSAFGVSNYMREIVGYAPVEPDGSVRIRVPANVAFQVSVLDANARRTGPVQGAWLQVAPGEVLSCNGCHTPAAAQMVPACTGTGVCATPHSHGRAGAFTRAYAGAAGGGSAYAGSVAMLATGQAVIPLAGDTMAQTRARATCPGSTCSEQPSLDVLYTDVWTAGTPNEAVNWTYVGVPAIPTTAVCESGWAASCRTRINYPAHIQPIWDAMHPINGGAATQSCSGSCHNPAGGPAAQLDLSSTVSNNNPPWPVSYVDLLIPQTQTDADGNTTVAAGPFLDAGDSNGVNSIKSLAIFDPSKGDTIHRGALTPAELRLISEWLDIGAQYFNNPFDPAVPVN